MFSKAFKDVSIRLHRYFIKVKCYLNDLLRCQESFTVVTKKFEGCFKGNKSVFQAILREISKKCKCFKGAKRSFRTVLREF